MNTHRIIPFFLTALFLTGFAVNSLKGQKSQIGLAPMFQKTLYQEKGEFDFNMTPVFLEGAFDENAGIRLYPYLNLTKLNEQKSVFKNAGLELAMPVYFLHFENESKFTHHIYASPGALFLMARPGLWDFNLEVSLFIEPGYSVRFDDEFALTGGIQIGKTFNSYAGENYWSNFLTYRLTFARLL